MEIPTAEQVKYDDLREVVHTFVGELKSGKEFIADHKETQAIRLQSRVRTANETLMHIYRSLQHGKGIRSPSEARW